MNKTSIFIISIILLFIIVIIAINHSAIIFTPLISVLVAFVAFIVSNWFWKNINSPEILIGFHDSSDNLGTKQPQEITICRLKNNERENASTTALPPYKAESEYQNLSGTIPNVENLMALPQFYGTTIDNSVTFNEIQNYPSVHDKKMQIFTLEINNMGNSAAINALLYFKINGISQICKWDSVPEPTSNRYLYNAYQRLTLLQTLPERAAFVLRFRDDPLDSLRQYDLILIYKHLFNIREDCSDKIDQIKAGSNKIDFSNKKSGELIIYSEDYKGKCGISFTYDNKKKKIIITLKRLKLKKWDDFKSISIDKNRNTLEIPYDNKI